VVPERAPHSIVKVEFPPPPFERIGGGPAVGMFAQQRFVGADGARQISLTAEDDAKRFARLCQSGLQLERALELGFGVSVAALGESGESGSQMKARVSGIDGQRLLKEFSGVMGLAFEQPEAVAFEERGLRIGLREADSGRGQSHRERENRQSLEHSWNYTTK